MAKKKIALLKIPHPNQVLCAYSITKYAKIQVLFCGNHRLPFYHIMGYFSTEMVEFIHFTLDIQQKIVYSIYVHTTDG